MKRLLYPLSLLALLTACYNSDVDATRFDMSLVVTEDKMVAVMTDIHLLEGVVAYEQSDPLPVTVVNQYYSDILEKHGLTEQQYLESMSYYTYHVEIFDRIMEKVTTNLMKLEAEVISGE